MNTRFCFLLISTILILSKTVDAQDTLNVSMQQFIEQDIENSKQLNVNERLFKLPADGELNYGVSVFSAFSSEGDTPFWLHANRYDVVDQNSSNLGTRLFFDYRYPLSDNFSVFAGSDILARYSDNSDLRLQQAYIGLQYANMILYGGRKIEQFGLVHPTLSLGSMDWSPNVRPMTKIVFRTDGFQPIPFTRDFAFFDFYYSHGWMNDNKTRFVNNTMLHQKYAYLRLFREEHVFTPVAGVVHSIQWGGHSPTAGQIPASFRNYLQAVFSQRATPGEFSEGWEVNRYGNSVGIYDFAVLLHFDFARISIGRQFYLEDTPNARFAAPMDGLWSLTMVRKNVERTLIHSFTYEHVNTLEQLSNNPKRRGSTANYYNHTVYRGGWTYYGRVIGTPLYFSDENYFGVVNNELIAHHIGFTGNLSMRLSYRAFATYSRNYGAQNIRRVEGGSDRGNFNRKDQYSFMLELERSVFQPNVVLKTAIGYDTGEVYTDNLGMLISISWYGN